MSDLSLAALKPAPAPNAQARGAAPPSDTGARAHEISRRPGAGQKSREDGAEASRQRPDAGRSESGASSASDGNQTRNDALTASNGAPAGGPGEDAEATSATDAAVPFATLLAAQLEDRPAAAPVATLAAVAAGVAGALAEAASAAVTGGNGLPPAALERAIARHGGTQALPAQPGPVAAADMTLAAKVATAAAGEEPGAAATRDKAVAPMAVPPTAHPAEQPGEAVTRSRAVAPLAAQPADERRATAELGTTPLVRDGAGIAVSAGSAVEAAAAQAGRLSALVDAPLGHARWSQAFNDRVSWLVREGGQLASLRLDPPQLGPVDVRVSVSNGETSLSFVSAHAPVREAIEAALPRLREMLGEQGLALGNVDVSGRESREQGEARDGRGAAGRELGDGADDIGDPAAPHSGVARIRLGLLDQYA